MTITTSSLLNGTICVTQSALSPIQVLVHFTCAWTWHTHTYTHGHTPTHTHTHTPYTNTHTHSINRHQHTDTHSIHTHTDTHTHSHTDTPTHPHTHSDSHTPPNTPRWEWNIRSPLSFWMSLKILVLKHFRVCYKIIEKQRNVIQVPLS